MNKLQRSFKKLINKAWNHFDRNDVLDTYTQAGVDIFKYALYNDDNIKYLSPRDMSKMYIVTKEYVLNKDVSTFIVFDYNGNRNSKLTTVNHQFKYDYEIPPKTADIMKHIFDEKVEEDRKAMEAEILSNITSSIQHLVQVYKDKLEQSIKIN